MSRFLNRVPDCRVCDLITSCTPVIESILAFQTLMFGVALAAHPELMAGGRAFRPMLDIMAQGGWSALFIGLAFVKVIAVVSHSHSFRFITLAAGMMVWALLAYVTVAESPVPLLTPWWYGALATINAVALVFVGWDAGRVRASA